MLRKSTCTALFSLLLAGCGDPVVVADYLTVINISPSHGALGVDPSADVLITFNSGLDETSLTDRVTLIDSTSSVVPTTAEYIAEDFTVALRPDGPLVTATTYTLSLSAGIVGDYGELLASVRSEFTTAGGTVPTGGELLAVPTVMEACIVGLPLLLDGGASEGPEGTALEFSWRVVSQPEGDPAQLNGFDQPTAELLVYVEGLYTVGLTVSAGDQSSAEALLDIDCAADTMP